MRPLGRRRIYLVFAPVAWIVMPITWALQQQASPVVRFTYPLLVAYLIWAWLRLRLVPASVVQVERATFWALAGFWLGSMAIREWTEPDPALLWRQLSPSIFMGLTICLVMAFLWFDTGAALRRSVLVTVGSTVVGLCYFVPRPGAGGEYLIDLVRYEIYLGITAVFVFALARSKDALMASRMEVEQMRTMAYRDPLTGLANRRFALDELNRLVRLGVRAGVVLVDLDEFKGINDRHGHEIGDEVLVRVAALLAPHRRPDRLPLGR